MDKESIKQRLTHLLMVRFGRLNFCHISTENQTRHCEEVADEIMQLLDILTDRDKGCLPK